MPTALKQNCMTTLTLDGHRDGITYTPDRDRLRLNRQARTVYDVMIDGHWRTLSEIARCTGEPEPSISARLRDLRKPRFGSHTVERRYIACGLWEYRVLLPQITQFEMEGV